VDVLTNLIESVEQVAEHVLDMVCVSAVTMYVPFKVQSPLDSFDAALRPVYQVGRMCCISELPVSRRIDSGRVVKPVKVQVPVKVRRRGCVCMQA
jgi:hypothetical protein